MGQNRKNTELTSSMYFEDEGNLTSNKGQRIRAKFIENSKIVELCGPINCGFWETSRYIMPNTEIILRLKRQNPDFIIIREKVAGTPIPTVSPYKIEFVYARLQIVRHQINEPFVSQIQKQLKVKPAMFPFKRNDLRIIHVPSNLYTMATTNVLIGVSN